MRKNEGRTVGLYFKVSPEEHALIKRKMEEAGTANKRAYLRKMAVDGYIVRLDLPCLKELAGLLRVTSSNVNQIARRANETGNLYAEDVEDIRKGYAGLHREMLAVAKKLKSL